MDIRELLNHIRAGSSDRQIAWDIQIDRRTVKRYREWAEEQGLLEGTLPALGDLLTLQSETLPSHQPPQNISSVEPYRELVAQMVKENVEIAAVWCRLKERGFSGSYSAVRRFVREIKPLTPQATVRVEREPGAEGQVDFGYAGKMIDPETGQLRKAWVFVMLLAWSRHQYAEFVCDQKVETWLRLHRNALAFFGGAPRRIVIDKLKAAIIQAIWDDPEVQQS
jgi:transposase